TPQRGVSGSRDDANNLLSLLERKATDQCESGLLQQIIRVECDHGLDATATPALEFLHEKPPQHRQGLIGVLELRIIDRESGVFVKLAAEEFRKALRSQLPVSQLENDG